MIVESVESVGPAMGARAALHLDLAFRHMMRGPGCVQNAGYLRLVTGEAHPMGNVAVVADPGDLEAVQEAIAPLLTCGAPAATIFPRGLADSVAAAVKARGFTVEAGMPAMAVDIERMAATSLPPGYEWARIGAGDEGRAWFVTQTTAYEIPPGLAEIFGPEALGADMAHDAQIQFFSVLRAGRHVATSLLYLDDGLAGIYCVSTRPEEREKGLGAHATAEALRAARHLGYRVGVLQSSTAGYPVYLRLGFGDYARVPMLIHLP